VTGCDFKMAGMDDIGLSEAADALVAGGITGPHMSHRRRGNISKIHSMLKDDVESRFGISGFERYSAAEILELMARLTGCSKDPDDPLEQDYIDPSLTIAAIVAGARRLRSAAEGGQSLLAATGHPTGLLEHHMRVVDAYRAAGGRVTLPREQELFARGGRTRIRYVGSVACLCDGASLLHTHSSEAMEALLEAKPWPEIVLADHGYAGAALERDIATVAFMDINDQALALPWDEGKDVVIVPLDDNREPRFYEPSWKLFEQILAGGEPRP
jgi:hypothetical protein